MEFGNERGLGEPILSQRRDLNAVNLSDSAVVVERTHNLILAGNIDGIYHEFSFEVRQEGKRKIYFLCSTAYTVPTRRGVGGEGSCK